MKAAEALSAADLSDAQSEHYNLDDKMRRLMGQLSLAQKRDVVAQIEKLAEKMNANDNESGS